MTVAGSPPTPICLAPPWSTYVSPCWTMFASMSPGQTTAMFT